MESTDDVSKLTATNNVARLVDQKITFHIKINPYFISIIDSHIEQFEHNFPSEQLINLSIQSGLYSRYKIDPDFKNNEFENLYLAWIENSVNKKIADHTFVKKEDGEDPSPASQVQEKSTGPSRPARAIVALSTSSANR